MENTMNYLPVLMSVALFSLLVALFGFMGQAKRFRRTYRRAQNEVEDLHQLAIKQKEGEFETGRAINSLQDALSSGQKIQAELERAVKLLSIKAQEAVRAKDEQVSVIEYDIRERNQWKRLYRESSLSNQVAQDWVMRDLERAIVVANVYAKELKRKPIRVDPGLKGLIATFSDTHGTGADIDNNTEENAEKSGKKDLSGDKGS